MGLDEAISGSADINTSILPLLLVLLSPFYDHRRWGRLSSITVMYVISGGHIMASWDNEKHNPSCYEVKAERKLNLMACTPVLFHFGIMVKSIIPNFLFN
jgi:hypothetical protein